MVHRYHSARLIISTIAIIASLSSSLAHGASLVVTNTLDSGAGSLRAAMLTANSNGQPDTITFQPPTVYNLTLVNSLPVVTEGSLTVDGTGTTVSINGASKEAFFFNAVTGCAVKNLSIAGAQYAVRVSGGSGHTFENLQLSNNNWAVNMDSTSSNLLRGSTITSNTNAVVLRASSNNTIGGSTPSAANRISGHASQAGILIEQITTPAVITSSNNIIIGNRIGLNAAGNAAQANLYGIHITSGPGTRIGGTATGEGNYISGNTYGIRIRGVNTQNVLVQGNFIGTADDGTTVVPNSFYGISIESSASRATIGGSSAAHSNVIKGNGLSGIFITSAASIRNRIERNSIFQNTSAGITLASNGNINIAAPVLQGPNPAVGTLGTVAFPAILQLYVDNAAQGETWVQQETVNAAGTFNFNTALAAYEGKNLTATITDVNGNTSPFSAPILIDVTPPNADFAVDDPIVVDQNALLLINNVTDNFTSPANVDMRFSNDGITWSAWEPYAPTKAWVLENVTGVQTVRAEFRDDSLNVSTKQATIEIDSTPPTGGVSLGAPVYTSPLVTLDLTPTAADNNSPLSGIEMRFSNDAITWSPWEVYAATKAWDLNQDLLDTSDGFRGVVMQLRDEAGNVSSTYSASAELDTTGPVVTDISLVDPLVSDLTSVRIEITFDEPILNFDTGVNLATDDLNLNVTGLTDTYFSEIVANSLTTYTLVIETGTGDGTISVDVIPATVTDDHGNLMTGTFSSDTYVIDRLRITVDPVGGTPTEDDAFSFGVASEGGLGTLHYSWLKNGVPIPDAPDAPLYDIPVLTLADTGAYSCVVSDDYVDVTSGSALLDVQIRIPVASGAGLALLSGVLALGFARAAGKRRRR